MLQINNRLNGFASKCRIVQQARGRSSYQQVVREITGAPQAPQLPPLLIRGYQRHRRGRRACSSLDSPAFQPQKQNQQAPQVVSQIRLPVQVALQDLLDGRGVEQPAMRFGAFAQRFHQQLPQRAAQPFVGGNIESRLLAFQNGRRQLVPPQFPQHQLLPRSGNLQLRGQRGGEFHDAVVQKRRSHFHRVGHAHAVALYQDIVRQVILLVEPL